MSSETELKLVPQRNPKERSIRKKCQIGIKIRQCYVKALGKRAPECVRIRKVGKTRYLELIDPSEGDKKRKKRKRFWRAKLSPGAWERLKTKASVLRVRRSEVIDGKDLGEIFYEVTVKEGMTKDIQRHEWEKPIPRWAFRLLWAAGTGKRSKRVVRKRRYYVKDGGNIIHVDFFQRRLKGLVVLEPQFARKKAARKFQRKHGKRQKGSKRVVFRKRPRFIDGRCLDVTHLRSAGSRSLAARRRAPRFW